ncbi:hypothetical protein [Chitinivibrio alkaliphilus]|uniref:Uncharacterized protein n=1 Tax=Chitinivibrio alkaliphilus ACht1 TaxID=1313304 RepID=U7D681_9BACT|nr:hypothetical protein [Chitinivibrio alkaliphilus]ERP31443.1 hypothetical protein CALK_1644 [Chitinivibrio alkaliphilus ACht1]
MWSRNLFILFVVPLFFLGCGILEPSSGHDDEKEQEYSFFATTPFFAPAQKETSLLTLYTSSGTSLRLSSGDLLRIRFFDHSYVSREDTISIKRGQNLDALFTQIIQAVASHGYELALSLEEGEVQAKFSPGDTIYNLTVENLSDHVSKKELRRTLYWSGTLWGTRVSAGRLLSPAAKSDLLTELRDPYGRRVGIEAFDTIFVMGSISNKEIPPGEYLLRIDPHGGGETVEDLHLLIRTAASAAGSRGYSFGVVSRSPHERTGAFYFQAPHTDRSKDSLVVFAKKARGGGALSPAIFNDMMVYEYIPCAIPELRDGISSGTVLDCL